MITRWFLVMVLIGWVSGCGDNTVDIPEEEAQEQLELSEEEEEAEKELE